MTNTILTIFPDFVFHLAVTLGFLGVIATLILYFIPLQKTLQIATFIISVALLSVGLYFSGAINQRDSYKQKIKDLEVELEKAKSEVNIKTVTKVIYRTQKIKETGTQLGKEVDRIAPTINNCPVPKSLVDIHNAAARNESVVQVENSVTTNGHNEAAKPALRLAPKK